MRHRVDISLPCQVGTHGVVVVNANDNVWLLGLSALVNMSGCGAFCMSCALQRHLSFFKADHAMVTCNGHMRWDSHDLVIASALAQSGIHAGTSAQGGSSPAHLCMVGSSLVHMAQSGVIAGAWAQSGIIASAEHKAGKYSNWQLANGKWQEGMHCVLGVHHEQQKGWAKGKHEPGQHDVFWF